MTLGDIYGFMKKNKAHDLGKNFSLDFLRYIKFHYKQNTCGSYVKYAISYHKLCLQNRKVMQQGHNQSSKNLWIRICIWKAQTRLISRKINVIKSKGSNYETRQFCFFDSSSKSRKFTAYIYIYKMNKKYTISSLRY